MTERDLKDLKSLPVPAPRADAKARALQAAMAAFESDTPVRGDTQGFPDAVRPISAPHRAARRTFMTLTRPQYALAASIAALMIAAPIAFKIASSDRPEVWTGARLPEPAKVATRAVDARDHGRADSKIAGEEVNAPATNEKRVQTVTVDKPVDAPANPNLSGEVAATAAQQSQSGNTANTTIAAIPPPPPASTSSDLKAKKQASGKGDEADAVPRPAEMVAAAPLAPPSPQPTDGLGAIGGYAGIRPGMADHDLNRNLRTSVLPPLAEMAKSETSVLMETERLRSIAEQEYRDKFEAKDINPIKQVANEPVSTFSIDVDTASYSFVRRALNAGRLPPKDAVRVEELINYFPYDYAKPDSAETPFKPTVTVMPSPWNASNQLVHIAIKGYDVQSAERPRANLVFLMDVSGSMEPSDRLPLVKNAFRMLVDELKPDDTVAIVTYASGSGVALEPTKISDKSKILAAIDKLGAGGSTAGADGIQDAYRLAETNFDKSAVNRVILATDGDFNVGVTDPDDLKGLIERKREKGIFLSILGVGEGNYNDSLMQTLAQNGNGTAAYVDTLNEARKVLVDESSSTLFPIAKDVKIQIEWNPARVQEYRLVGYETRALRREDFNNDRIDAGDIGSGHTVTAIYEVTPVGATPMVDNLRYNAGPKTASSNRAEPAAPLTQDGEIGFLKLRYKLPKEDASKLVSIPIASADAKTSIDAASADTRFSVAVAGFGQLLKGAPYMKGFTYDDVLALAQPARGDDKFGYRSEFLNLVRLAKSARP